MTFPQSIAHGFANYANFRGRDKRAAFWWWALFNFLVSAAAGILDGAFGSEFVRLPRPSRPLAPHPCLRGSALA